MKRITEEFLNLFQIDGLIQGYLFDIKDEETLKEIYDFYWEFYSPLSPLQRMDCHDIIITLLNAGRSKRLGNEDELLVYFDDDFEEGYESMKSILDTHIVDLDDPKRVAA